MISIPTAKQVIHFFYFGGDTQSLLISSLALTATIIFLPVILGFALYLLEKFQIFLLSLINRKVAYIFVNYITFPGTIIHESSHLLLAFITGAKINEVCFLESKGDRLGHVSYSTRGPFMLQMAQNALSACAPTIIGIASGYFLLQYIFSHSMDLWKIIILWYLVISLIDHSTMSDADLKLYFKGVWIFLVPFFAIAFCLFKFTCA